MNLAYDFRVFIRILIINALVTLVYIVFNLFRGKKRRNSFLFKSLLMLLCPIVGPVYVLFSRVLMFIFFRKPVNLEDVIFSKERESILVNAEEEKERNIVSITDALIISGKEDSRDLLLDVIKRTPRTTLRSIAQALDSTDSELSHYAASIIQAETAKIHKYVQETRNRILALEAELQKRESSRDEDGTAGIEVTEEAEAASAAAAASATVAASATAAAAVVSSDASAEELMASGVGNYINDKRKIGFRTEAGSRFFAQRLYRLRLSGEGEASDMVYSNGSPGHETEDQREFEAYYADISEKLEESKDYSKHKKLALKQGLIARDGVLDDRRDIMEKLTEEMSNAHSLIKELDNILSQRVLTEFDSNRYLDILHEISKLVEKRDVLTEDEIGRNVALMLNAGRIDAAAEWTYKAAAWYPDSLVKYSTRVRLCFARNDREGFFKALDEMKQSDLQLDQDMLELARFFA
jgi:hypothetical protein